jgi:chromate reductase
MNKKLAVIVGSLRKESFSRKLAKVLMQVSADTIDSEIVEIGELPIYNQDFDDHNNVPAAYTTFRDKMQGFEAVLFVTPEYNRSVSGVLKNAIDVGSRPYGKSIWDKKPAAIVSSSPGSIGGFGANQAIRQSLVFLNMPCLQMPEAYISNVAALFDDKGNLINDSTKDFLAKFMQTFASWINTNTVKG